MKKLLILMPVLLLIMAITPGCNDDDTWNDYAEWREANDKWLADQGMLLDDNNQAFYTRQYAEWNKSAYVLIHYFNDRELTKDNLKPIFTSTVAVKYKGCLYNSVPFDSSYTAVDSLFTTQIGNVISGWGIALQSMHVGDSVRIVVPYQQGYGTSSSGMIPPYSALQFDIKLVNLPTYEVKP